MRAAGAVAAQGMPDLTEAEAQRVLALLAPYRDQLIKPMVAAAPAWRSA